VLPDFIPYYSVGHFIGFAVNGILALLCLVVLGLYRHYRPLRSLFLFYLCSTVFFWGEVTYGLQKSNESILLGYRVTLAALALLPASWTWFVFSLFGERPRTLAWGITGISLFLMGSALLGEGPYLLGLPLELHLMAPDILRPQSWVLKPAVLSFCLMVCLFYFLWIAIRIRHSEKPRPVHLIPVVIGLLFWLIGGLHDALRSTGVIALTKGQVIWFTSLWLSLFLTVAMALHFRGLEKTVHEARDVFERFVPPAYLQRIASEGLGSIRLGEADLQTATILSCDIRGFTALSEELDPGNLVCFVNRLFQRFTQIVDQRQGVIDKFLGDALLCIFEGTSAAERAVACGVDLLSDVRDFNNREEQTKGHRVRIGIGLHSGPVILGTIGSPDRMDSTVLGLTVNLAKRLEGLTKQLGVDMVVSQQVVNQLIKGHPHQVRLLGEVLVKGSSSPITIVEVYDHEVLGVKELKKRVEPLMAEGMELCKSGQIHAAFLKIEEAKALYPQDRSLQLLAASLACALEKGDRAMGGVMLDLTPSDPLSLDPIPGLPVES
jgi:adenylate cyclase